MGSNLRSLSDFNGINLIRTDGTYYEQNLIVNAGSSGINVSFLFSSTNVSLAIFSKSYYGPLPITAVLIS
jgi:hypothetical protein